MSAVPERRLSVRVRPLPELPARVSIVGQAVGATLMVADISVGGVGIFVQRGEGPKLGERISLELRLASESVTVDAEVRHVTRDGAVSGVQFVDTSGSAHRAISAYVGELIDRGSIS